MFTEENKMLDKHGFDLWADGYDKSVGLSDEEGTYPFAGYRQILNEIYNRILSRKAKSILDIGFGTGTLTTKLYERGCDIWGQDFSERMIEIAKAKMPKAKLYQGDFTHGLVEKLKQNRYDAIIATYPLHHLSDAQKVYLLKSIMPLLNSGGCIYIGDVAFDSRIELDYYRNIIGDDWDDEEVYFVVDETLKLFPQMKFERFSFCAGLFSIER